MLESPQAAELPTLERPPAPPAPPPKPRVWPVWLAFMMLIGGVMVGSVPIVLVAFAAGYGPDRMMQAPGMLHASGLVSGLAQGASVLFALVVLKDAGGGWRLRLALDTRRFRVADAALLSLAMVSLGSAIDETLFAAGIQAKIFVQFAEATRAMGPIAFALVFPFMALSPGFFEELFFRGLAQQRFVERHGPALGIVIASALFGLIHGDLIHTPVAALLGLLLGWAAWRSGTIVTGMVAHAVNNALSFTGMRFFEQPSLAERPWWLLGSAVSLAACTFALHLRWRERPSR